VRSRGGEGWCWRETPREGKTAVRQVRNRQRRGEGETGGDKSEGKSNELGKTISGNPTNRSLAQSINIQLLTRRKYSAFENELARNLSP
jgi:hypothetical protein